MNTNPIGIFDSGIGGLSILKEIKKLLPQESIVYFADSENCPYGGKEKEVIYTLAKARLSYLAEKGVKLIVIACNTVTVSCIEELRENFASIPIVGIVPVVKKASEESKSKKIGILSTSTTSKSEYQARLIQQYASDCEVVAVGTDELVPLIERGETESQELDKVLRKTLKPFLSSGIDTLALGCSHFPLIKDKISHILGNDVLILDSGGAVARHVQRILSYENLESNDMRPFYEYVTSGDLQQFKKALQNEMGEKDATIRSI